MYKSILAWKTSINAFALDVPSKLKVTASRTRKKYCFSSKTRTLTVP